MDKNTLWIKEHLKYIAALSSPNQQQQRFIELASLDKRTPLQQKQLNAVTKLEKLSMQMVKAKADAAKIETAAKRDARKKRDHEMYESAGLMSMAGLLDKFTGKPLMNKAELLGALMGLAKVPADDQRRDEWRRVGQEKLNQASSTKTKPQAEPA